MDFKVCKLKYDNEGGMIPGKEIGNYKSDIMLAPGKEITVNSKKYKVRCIDINHKNGEKCAIV